MRDVMSEPVFIYGKGRNQITLKGDKAIEAAGWSIRVLLLLRGFSLFTKVLAAGGALSALGVAIKWAIS